MEVRLLYHNKSKTKEGDSIEIKIWKVPKSKEFPDEIKYSLAFIHKGERLIGYDNERTKGHHKHIKNQEIKMEFKDHNKLIEDFEKDIKNIQKELYGGKNGNKN
jgi:hypothetical protein|tara:strand:- start:2340 stop:2651 length:312 start_codon:yes stop_codon:yes gene_type:complete